VITWFAFQCPETKREYFYEPLSGEKTWTLPTSKHIITNTHKAASAKHQVISEPQPIKRQGGNMGINTNPPTKLGLAVAMTLAVSLICNTVFLVVLVKLTGPHHNLPGPVSNIPDAVPGDEPHKQTNINLTDLCIQDDLEEFKVEEKEMNAPESSAAEIIGGVEININEHTEESKPHTNEQQKQRGVKEVGNEGQTTQNNFAVSQNEQEQSTSNNNEVVDANLHESGDTLDAPALKTADHNTEEKNTEKGEAIQNQESSNAPTQCWVPFAYVVNPSCRRKRLQRPMFDAEHFVRAMI
jgi:hypothetical protein